VGKYFSDGAIGHKNVIFSKSHSNHRFDNRNTSLLTFSFDEFRRHLGLFFTAIFLSYLLRINKRIEKLKQEKLAAELSSLKSQINPHFLFNSLNSIYSLSIIKDPKASEAIINLSGLMRYVIKEANEHKIALKKELEYLTNYIELQKARLGNTAYINFETTGNTEGKEIAPLILITFIENAFKYGINPDIDGCSVDIKINIINSTLTLKVFNNKVAIRNTVESTGIGIANTAERLKILYPNKHVTTIDDNKDSFFVTLSLELV
jgi:LytS/YehU family sensor histidine kinase